MLRRINDQCYFDGDYIVVKEQQDAHDGEIVVALIDDSATVKRRFTEETIAFVFNQKMTLRASTVQNPVI